MSLKLRLAGEIEEVLLDNFLFFYFFFFRLTNESHGRDRHTSAHTTFSNQSHIISTFILFDVVFFSFYYFQKKTHTQNILISILNSLFFFFHTQNVNKLKWRCAQKKIKIPFEKGDPLFCFNIVAAGRSYHLIM